MILTFAVSKMVQAVILGIENVTPMRNENTCKNTTSAVTLVLGIAITPAGN